MQGDRQAGDSDFALHRRSRNYIIGVALAFVASLVALWRILLVHDWRLVGSLEIGWIMIAVWIYLGMRYQVLWQNGRIVMKALGRPDTAIEPDTIIQVAIDTAERARIAGIGKHSERIKIVAKEPNAEPASVYISLGHFAAADVGRLMRVIAECRPDLAFPRKWEGK